MDRGLLKQKATTKKILVVDDEPPVCNMLKKFLLQKGYKVDTALSGKEALKIVRKKKPHIVLLDIKMPEMDGLEVLQRIVEIDKEVGVIMITAVKQDNIGKRCIQLGAYDYIIKPLNLDYLETVLMVKLLDFPK
jgi:DNA-binding response OmpR family regulator